MIMENQFVELLGQKCLDGSVSICHHFTEYQVATLIMYVNGIWRQAVVFRDKCKLNSCASDSKNSVLQVGTDKYLFLVLKCQ